MKINSAKNSHVTGSESKTPFEQFKRNVLARMVHAVWLLWRKHVLISSLERRKNDLHFLNDIGLTQKDVEREIEKLRAQKPF
ncbi:hypothetical protein BCT30_09355 [Enterovibrio norvegicus]|uniref:hypothetical protein n=1 Tax=Enterovibrio norvegicus TaxID=188144 RepID=UPI000C829864|nr:hypothetical protein [Enterovibrio norvegicus]PMH69696.1 hypothetical protein BCU62_06270 [Enterovibrio norvegicus]PMI35688.1 hypothetical protein BCU46_17550 [Enterovibrio norvegicus]PMN54923.1 hypothetical protein BCT30_09355 [Enterovibrio norvegicus]TKF37489.1 hypothetical protein FCV83_00005 [Enterovibrio norvegicus]